MSAWDKLYSEKVSSLRPSPIREMLHATRQPGMISFAGGNPDPESFPVDLFYESASILKEQGKDVLQYGTTEGYTPSKISLLDCSQDGQIDLARRAPDNYRLYAGGRFALLDPNR